MFGFMYTQDNKKTFAGLQNFFRLVADAPRIHANDKLLKDETILVNILTSEKRSPALGRPFDDKDNPAVRANYQRFFSVGGTNKDFLPYDFYNRMELIGIPVGKPPLQAKTPSPTPAPAPAPAPMNGVPGGMTFRTPAIGGLLNRDSLGFPLPFTDSEIDRLHPVITHMRSLQPVGSVSV